MSELLQILLTHKYLAISSAIFDVIVGISLYKEKTPLYGVLSTCILFVTLHRNKHQPITTATITLIFLLFITFLLIPKRNRETDNQVIYYLLPCRIAVINIVIGLFI